jgi:hypothetical protein
VIHHREGRTTGFLGGLGGDCQGRAEGRAPTWG